MSEINEIRRQFLMRRWPQFIDSVKIDKIRGWAGQTVEFRFPICAICGENGSGKSTVLRAIACAYENTIPEGKTFYPSKLFLNTRWDVNSVQRGATISFSIRQGNQQSTVNWKKTQDWGCSPKSNRPQRSVVFLDISRTLPLDATVGYAKIANSSIESALSSIELSDEMVREYSYIMGGNYSSAKFVRPQPNREVGLLTNRFGEISQFHQGAGEDALLDLMRILEIIPDTSLLIIDEVEASSS